MDYTETAVWLSAVLVSAIMVFTRKAWRFSRHGATLTHELGHAVFGMLTMARISGIRLHMDSSGVTHSIRSVRVFPIGAIISGFSGYPAPIIFGSVFLSLLFSGHPMEAMYTILIAGLVTLLFIRNLFGLLVTLIWVVSAATVVLFVPWAIPWYVVWTGSLLIFGGFKDLTVLRKIYKRAPETQTDLYDLRMSSHIPQGFWYWTMWIVSIANLGLPALFLAERLTP